MSPPVGGMRRADRIDAFAGTRLKELSVCHSSLARVNSASCPSGSLIVFHRPSAADRFVESAGAGPLGTIYPRGASREHCWGAQARTSDL